jgi:hypothetical protein
MLLEVLREIHQPRYFMKEDFMIIRYSLTTNNIPFTNVFSFQKVLSFRNIYPIQK